MKARSPALQTFIIQLAGPGTYIPSLQLRRSRRRLQRPSSRAIMSAPKVARLTDQTVEVLGSLWPTN
ncbi:MAG: hypothetical protein R3C56_07585 [Pirellulaceae bacterium]